LCSDPATLEKTYEHELSDLVASAGLPHVVVVGIAK
jgi:hypothetical protein